ncbi:PorT family protein [Spirosoma sp. KCTC 42546]|uniref:outer membrane beta-barrel protein n=1 Tax=Spirosoma sp. KCTC 42546 TaxID=2520506 RepID=UPI00115C3FF8|nr:outer membrane beta-barrel protein [Spirosoma sp. KCTC 42546]QDK78216.1 PorT family protein [Spirosoma sp. KCTC 42546]
MKLSQLSFAVLLLVSTSAAIAQNTIRTVEFGIKGGGTFTHGYTTIPGQAVGSVQVPNLENKNNGIGYGYSGGLWARKNFSNFFIQAEVTYNRFVLNQVGIITVDVNANAALANALPVSVQPGILNATLNVVSESVLEAVDVPVLFGKRWMGGKLRGYAGPNFIFIQKAEATRTTSGVLNANSSVAFPKTDIPATTGKTNLLNKYEAQNLEVKDFTYALEVGVGYTPVPFLDVDLRYAAPVGGVYKDTGIKGFLGIATLSLGFKVF